MTADQITALMRYIDAAIEANTCRGRMYAGDRTAKNAEAMRQTLCESFGVAEYRVPIFSVISEASWPPR